MRFILGSKKKQKKVKKEEKSKEEILKEKYGVTKEIPKRKIESEGMPFKHMMQPKNRDETELPDIILRMEKLDGKIEVMNRFKDEINERITHLAEEIGELRTMIMERDRSFDKVSAEFETVKDSVNDIQPRKLKSYFEKKEKDIVLNKANIEKLENLVKALNEENKQFRNLISKIKSFENLVNISYNIDRKASKIKESKDHVDMAVSKVENIFSEMNDKVSELESQREKVDKMDGLTIEMTKMLDEITIKLNKFVEKKELNQYLRKIEASPIKDRMPISKAGSIPPSSPIHDSRILELSSQLSRLKSVIDSQNIMINNIVSKMRSGKVAESSPDIRKVMLSLRFFQIMNILSFERHPNKIKNYLSEVKDLAREMKSSGLWNDEKHNYMKEILNKLSRRIEPLGSG